MSKINCLKITRCDNIDVVYFRTRMTVYATTNTPLIAITNRLSYIISGHCNVLSVHLYC